MERILLRERDIYHDDKQKKERVSLSIGTLCPIFHYLQSQFQAIDSTKPDLMVRPWISRVIDALSHLLREILTILLQLALSDTSSRSSMLTLLSPLCEAVYNCISSELLSRRRSSLCNKGGMNISGLTFSPIAVTALITNVASKAISDMETMIAVKDILWNLLSIIHRERKEIDEISKKENNYKMRDVEKAMCKLWAIVVRGAFVVGPLYICVYTCIYVYLRLIFTEISSISICIRRRVDDQNGS